MGPLGAFLFLNSARGITGPQFGPGQSQTYAANTAAEGIRSLMKKNNEQRERFIQNGWLA